MEFLCHWTWQKLHRWNWCCGERQRKGLVLTREAIVNDTKDFVAAFRSKESKITLIELTDTDIGKINGLLKLNDIFANAHNVRGISKFHQLIFDNGKTKGFATSADGFKL